MSYVNSYQTSSHNQFFQELPLKLPSNSSYSTRSFKFLIDEVQKKQNQERISKQHSRLLKHKQIQQRFRKMKILNQNQQEQIKTNQASKKKISDCYVSLRIEMNKINDRTDSYLKHKPNQADLALPYLKQSSSHIDAIAKKRQEAVLRGCSNKWKVVLNQQEKNINLLLSRTLRSASPKERDRSKQKRRKFQKEALKTDKFNIFTTAKRKKTIKGQFSHLKKKFLVMNQENIKKFSRSSSNE